jgi:hypothetical protein
MSTTSDQSIGEIIGGLALAFISGVLNGSYNAAFNPKLPLAVGPRKTVEPLHLGRQSSVIRRLSDSFTIQLPSHIKYDLEFNHAWMLFQFYSAIINCVVCLFWAGGPKNISFVLSQSSTSSIVLVVIFSFLWGIGSLFFGRACKIAGVGLGTNLAMSIVLMLGTFLPLLYDGGIRSAVGAIIITGLIVVCFGLYFSAESLRIRDLDLAKPAQSEVENSSSCPVDFSVDEELSNDEVVFSVEQLQRNGDEGDFENDVPVPKLSAAMSEKKEIEEPEYSTSVKISVCVLAGIFASMLQFAFIYGGDIIQTAEKSGNTPEGGSAAIIWLFAISIGSIPSIVYGFCSSPKEIPLKTLWLCPWWRHVAIICCTSIVWLTHIHTYGLSANVLLPKKFAASIAWPIVMTTSVATGMALSMCLGEWRGASSLALSKLWTGLGLSAIGVILFMSSIAFQ